jgi:hypothetical protein
MRKLVRISLRSAVLPPKSAAETSVASSDFNAASGYELWEDEVKGKVYIHRPNKDGDDRTNGVIAVPLSQATRLTTVKRDAPMPDSNVVDARCVACENGPLGHPFVISDGDTELTIPVCKKCQKRFRSVDEISSEDIRGMLQRLLDRGIIEEYVWDLDE